MSALETCCEQPLDINPDLILLAQLGQCVRIRESIHVKGSLDFGCLPFISALT